VSHAALHVNGKPVRKVLFHEVTRNVVSDTQFEYDIERRLIARTSAARGRREYQYDADSRLLAVRSAGEGTQAFTYDAAGNRAASTLGGALIEPGNRLVQQGPDRFAYDERGDVVAALLDGDQWHYTYDLRNQMREARGPRGVVSFAYDALGRRISKRTVERHVQYIWCGEQLAREIITSSVGTSVRDYAYLPGSHVPIALRVDGKSYYFHGDQQGTPELLTDSTGRVVWSASYEAFGAAQVDLAQVDNPLRYAGQYFDEETGLHYIQGDGRFAGEDQTRRHRLR
jgi:YD repeat-containing protein